MRRLSVFLLLLALSVHAQDDPFATAQKAAAAYNAAKYDEAVALYRKVREGLPRSISVRMALARALARTGANDEALTLLEEVAAYGVRFDDTDEAWAQLRSNPRFTKLAQTMRMRTAPIIRSTVAFRLEKDLIPENVAYDPKTNAFFVGSMYKAKILRIASDGTVTDFIPPRRDGLLGVLGMKVDAAKRELWAVSGNYGITPPMNFSDPESAGKGRIFRFNIDSGKLIRKYETPRLFNDVVLAPNGDAYLTAGADGIWRIAVNGDSVEPFFARAGSFFNGIAIAPDGKTIFGASHFDGVYRIDVKTRSGELIEVPAGVSLAGIDGLYVHDGSFVAVQNGTDPIRIIRAWLDPKMRRVRRFTVLEQLHPETDFPLTGVIRGHDLYYIGRSQLRAFEGDKIWPMDKLKDSTILKLPLNVK